MRSSVRATLVAVFACFALIVALAAPSGAQPPPEPDGRFDHDFATPVLGMNLVPNRRLLLVADAGAGIVRVKRDSSELIVPMPGVSDVLPVSPWRMFATTGEAPSEEPGAGQSLQAPPHPPASVFLITRSGKGVRQIADLAAAEAAQNPDGAQIESNPMDLAKLGRYLIVADAAANTIWRVDIKSGDVEPVAVLPSRTAQTQWLKDAVGCSDPGSVDPEFADTCGLPPEMQSEAVPTTVAIGRNGYIYVGELSGFPAGPGMSRIWKIHPKAKNVDCATSDMCKVVVDGLTSVIDINFAKGGRLIVVELDRATFLAAEAGMGTGGAVSRCFIRVGECADIATDIQLPTAVAVGRRKLWVTTWALVPGSADIIEVPLFK